MTVTATQDLVAILNGGSLASTSTASLFTTSNSIFNVGGADANGPGGIPSLRFFDISGNSGLTGSSATVSGPLITSSGDTFNVSGAFLRVAGPLFAPATLTHNNPGDANPFMQFTGSVMTLGNPNAPGTGNVVEVGFSPVSGSGIRYQGSGTFLQADTTGVAAWRADRLLLAQTPTPDGDPTLGLNSSSTSPLFSFTGAPLDPTTLLPGGTHTFNNSLFEIKGFNTTVESVLVEVISSGETVSITRGTDEPLRHLGELFRGSATPVQVGDAGGGAVKLDTALFNATKPIMNLINGSAATVGTGGATQVDLLKLIQNAKLNGALVPADALVKLDASTLSIPNGVLAAVSGGSLMNLTGGTTLLSVNNTSNVTINGSSFNAGALVSVTGNSVFKMTGGSLINFGGTGTNAVTIQTGILSFGACAGCVFQTIAIGGINAPVLLKGGATAANNIRVDPTFNAFPGRTLPGNSLTFNNFGSLFIVDGVNSKVVLNP